MAYKIVFTWAQNSSQLQTISCDEQNVPAEHFMGKPANWWMGEIKGEVAKARQQLDVNKAALTVNTVKRQCVRMPRGLFLYMDVGCWLKGKQTFGVICGQSAILCDYNPNSSKPGLSATTSSGPVESILSIPGVSIRKAQKIPPPAPSNPNHVLVVLPDMHVPESPPLTYPRPFDDGTWGANKRGNWRQDPNEFDRYASYDCIFESRKSITAMIKFLRDLRALSLSDISLVQLGDMYELWAGRRPCQFQQSDKSEIRFVDHNSAKLVGEWVGGIHEMQDDLFVEFDLCVKSMPVAFLHGNHDCYLSRTPQGEASPVVKYANDYIDMYWQRTDEYGGRRTSFKPTRVYPRNREYSEPGVFIEHGQRCDQANRDGERYGWDKTNSAVDFGPWKWFDSTRRRTFVAAAAVHWCISQMSYGIYVMGHTHEPDLSYVDVMHQKGRIEYRYSYGHNTVIKTPILIPEGEL